MVRAANVQAPNTLLEVRVKGRLFTGVVAIATSLSLQSANRRSSAGRCGLTESLCAMAIPRRESLLKGDDEMSIRIHISVESNHILVIAQGAYEQSDALDCYRKAFDAARKEKISKILIDGRKITGMPTMGDRFESGVLLSELTRGKVGTPVIKVAIVGSEPTVDPGLFGENVAHNRGVLGKVTTNLNEALEWLGI